jgi:carbon-monoxide dehydrogenase medium subunit
MPFIMKRPLKKFEYVAPSKLEDALAILGKLGEKAAILAGGTDLLVFMKDRAIMPQCIINIKNIAGMDYIKETEEGGLAIGALTPIIKINESKLIKQKYPSLHECTTKAFHSWQIRNMATIGGNICRSSPAADAVPPLMTYDAEVKLVGQKSERRVLLEKFFLGPNKNVLDREILTEIIIPPQKGNCGMAFESMKRVSVDLCKLNCAVKIVLEGNTCKDIRIALGAVAPTPIRAKKVEETVRDKEVTDELIEKASQKVVEDISPITDARSTAEYRKQVSVVMVRRLIKQAVQRAK